MVNIVLGCDSNGHDDAAYQSDNTCRMPTKADFEELKDNTTLTWETLNGVKGGRFTSNTNSNSIFVPAAGLSVDGSVDLVGSNGYCWSSSLKENDPNCGRYLYFDSGDDIGIAYDDRKFGLPVRPVKSIN